mgnify:CR=1 FL=1
MTGELLIRLEDDGRIQVQGPLPNKVLCYGLLELAKDIVRAHQGRAGSSLLVPEVRLQRSRQGDNGQPI